MADLHQILQNPDALKEFNGLSRSERAAILSDSDPDFKKLNVNERFHILDSIEAKTPVMAPPGTSPKIPTAQEEALIPETGPITDVLLGKAMMSSPPVKSALSAATEAASPVLEKAGSFANRVKTALTTSSKEAGQAIGAAERATPSAVKAGTTLAEFPKQIPFSTQSVNSLNTLEGQVSYINNLEKAAAKAETLPKEALNDYAKINDLVKDKLPSNLRARLFELDSKITGALNKAVPARGAAAQTLSDVNKAKKIIDALKSAGVVIGKGGLAALGFKGLGKLIQ